jgi:tripartite-type tricarboxylate transporter receptor subunit TctC
MPKLKLVLVTLATLCFLFVNPAAKAQPGRPLLHLVVGYTPGGSPDVLARILAQSMSENQGMTVIVENRPGAGGMVGAQYVKNAAPDGSVLFLGDSSMYAVNPNILPSLAQNPMRDFVPIALAATSPIFLVTSAKQVNTLKDLIALAESKPGMAYGSGGHGTTNQLAMELLKSMAKLDLMHVPYKGAGQLVPAVISGEVVAGFGGMAVTFPLAKSGKLKILGISTGQRSPLAPDVPTIAEAGVPGYEMSISLGFLAPPKTPPEIVQRLNAAIVTASQAPGVREKLAGLGVETATSSPKEFGDRIAREIKHYGNLVKLSDLKTK